MSRVCHVSSPYKIILSYSTIAIYKSVNSDRFYIANNAEYAGNGKHFPITDVTALRRAFYYSYVNAMGKNKISFDSYITRQIMEEALKIK